MLCQADGASEWELRQRPTLRPAATRSDPTVGAAPRPADARGDQESLLPGLSMLLPVGDGGAEARVCVRRRSTPVGGVVGKPVHATLPPLRLCRHA